MGFALLRRYVKLTVSYIEQSSSTERGSVGSKKVLHTFQRASKKLQKPVVKAC